jgi:hypothetical protein
MTKEEAVERARQVVEGEAWPWREPIEVRSVPCGVSGAVWEIVTNVEMRGSNARVHIDADTGEILHKAFGPR